MEDLLVWPGESAMVARDVDLVWNLVVPLEVLQPISDAEELVEQEHARPVILRPLLLILDLHLRGDDIVRLHDLLKVDPAQIAHEVVGALQVLLGGLPALVRQYFLRVDGLVAATDLVLSEQLLRVEDAPDDAISRK